MRQSFSGHNGFGSSATRAGAAYPSAENDRLNNLKRAIESIESRIVSGQMNAAQRTVAPPPLAPQAFPAQHPGYLSHAAQPLAGSAYGHNVYGLANSTPAPAYVAPYLQPTVADNELSVMKEQLARLSNQIAQTNAFFTAAPSQGVELSSIAAELQKRQQVLDAEAQLAQIKQAATEVARVPYGDPKTEEKLDQIGAVLSGLQKDLTALKKQVSTPQAAVKSVQQPVSQADIDRIANGIAKLQTAPSFDERAFDRLHKELEDLRAGMNEDMRRAVRREIATSNGNQANDISTRVDARIEALSQSLQSLSESFNSATIESANAVAPRVDHLANQLDALRVSVDDLPQTLAITRLEDQLGDVIAKMEALSAHNAKLTEESTRLTETVTARAGGISQQDLSSIEGRLDEVARALVAVSNSATKAAPAVEMPNIDLSGIDRVEARIAELGRAVDEIYNRDSASELESIAVRIDGLTERLGSFEKYAQSGDLGGASAMFAAPDIGVIEEQLRQLNARVEAQSSESAIQFQTQQLEEQLAHLAARVEEAANKNSTAAQMSNLEAQIGQIIRHMNKMDAASAPAMPPVDFSPVEARLGQIEQQLLNNQNFSIEAAQQAAQQAVAMMGANSDSGQMIAALAQDLRALQEAAESGTAQNAQTVQNVENTLQMVMDRLGSIENSISEVSATASAAAAAAAASASAPVMNAREYAAEVAHTDNDAYYDDQDEGDAAYQDQAQAAYYGAAVPDGAQAAYQPLPEDDSPLEPGSAAPDLNQRTTRAQAAAAAAREPVVSVDGPSLENARPGDDMRPDAVSAARRALQATTAEMNAVKSEAKSSSKLGGLGGKLGKAVPSLDMAKLRKPLVMGAAALLLAVIAFKGVGMFMDDGGKVVAKKKSKKAKVEMSAAAPKPADKQVKLVEEKVASKPETEVKDQTKREVDKAVADTAQADKPQDGGGETVVAAPKREAADSATGADADAIVSSETEVAAAPTSEPQVENAPDSVAENTTQVSVNPTEAQSAGDESQTAADAGIEVPSSAGSLALVQAASSGDPKALFQIGMRYSDGNDVKRNMTEAAKWLKLSAEKGFAPAQYSIGSLFEKGIGVERDVAAAAEWYEKAAAQGNARAMHNLAVINAMGNPPEIQPNMDKAVSWFQQAAAYGIKDSQFNLGILYGQGMGVPQNLGESYKWFALAAKTGDSDASSKRDEVANAMDPDDLDEARREVNNWVPQKLDEAANRVAVPKEWQGRGAPERRASGDTSLTETVKKAQTMLNQRGFKVGEPDGVIGPKTKRAIMEFQRSAGIPVTGKVDEQLINALSI